MGDLLGCRHFRVDDGRNADLFLDKVQLVAVGRVAHAGNGVAVARLFGKHTAQQVQLIRTGHGNEHVRILNAGFGQGSDGGTVAHDAQHVVRLDQVLHPRLVRVHNGHVVALLAELRARAVPTLPLPTRMIFITSPFSFGSPFPGAYKHSLVYHIQPQSSTVCPTNTSNCLKKRRFFLCRITCFQRESAKKGLPHSFCAAASLGQNDSECPPRALWASSAEKYRYKSKVSPAVRSQYRSTPSLVTRAYTSGASSGFSAPYTRPLRYSAAAASNLSAAP